MSGRAKSRSNVALGLNASQPPSQNCANDNDKQNDELHLDPLGVLSGPFAIKPTPNQDNANPKHTRDAKHSLRHTGDITTRLTPAPAMMLLYNGAVASHSNP